MGFQLDFSDSPDWWGVISCDMTIKVRAPSGWFGPVGDLFWGGGDLACKPHYVGRVCYYYFCPGPR